MKIIKQGKPKETGKNITCSNCNSELEYNRSDEHYAFKGELAKSFIVCPVCNHRITVE